MVTLCYNGYAMDIIIKKLSRCLYCGKPLELSASKGSKRKYCDDGHRKYAWKKRHWDQYLSWQRDYVRRKKYGVDNQNDLAGSPRITTEMSNA